jgi:hypothetical protein
MDINEKCVGCGNCHAVCTMGAISLDRNGRSVVDEDECVECSTCYRVLRDEGYGATFVRTVRRVLSALRLQYMAPVTGRLGDGDAGIVVELGRPGVGAHFRDVETVAMALAPLEPEFEPLNPVTQLMEDTKTGKMKEEVLDEKVLSAIIEVKTSLERIPEYLSTLQTVQREIDTVFSVGVASRCLPDGSVQHAPQAGGRQGPHGGLRHLHHDGEGDHTGGLRSQDPRVPPHLQEIRPHQHREQ